MEKRKTTSPLHTGIFFGLLLLSWVIFSGFFDVFHLSLGLISCAIVTWLSADLLFEDQSASLRRRLVQALRLANYILWLLWQIVLANIYMFRLAFSNRDALQPQIVRYETALKSDFEKFMLANSITLTPGTVTMKILGSTYYVHAINDFCTVGLGEEMERRIARIFSDSASTSAKAPTS